MERGGWIWIGKWAVYKMIEPQCVAPTACFLFPQLIQRHPALRGSASALSPFELQLLHSPAALAATHTALSDWLDLVDGTVDGDSPLSAGDFADSTRVWWQWMESVAELESNEQVERERQRSEEQRGEPMTKARTTSRANNDGNTSHRTGPSIGLRASFSARSHATPPSSSSSIIHPNIHPTRALWSALTHRSDSSAIVDSDRPSNPSVAALMRAHLSAPVGFMQLDTTNDQDNHTDAGTNNSTNSNQSQNRTNRQANWQNTSLVDEMKQLQSERSATQIRHFDTHAYKLKPTKPHPRP